ncbi:MAG: nucleotidyltransferase family protein [Lachnospiraceae bacterium]|nr:nucleotidyltransferase family protein [Lachnospiraceae bacterium]
MNVTGIIAEYNPFHNGHLYHLKRAKRDTGADYIVVAMSGDFVQRGAPAILDKYARTRMALAAGADLVLELPVYYATSSADYFAKGATALLDKLGVVDCLSFGSEHGRIEDLIGIAALSAHESPAYSIALNRYLVEGRSFAYANTHALMDACDDEQLKEMIEIILRQPNNSLGIAYIRSLMHRGSRITPHTIFRTGSDYNDTAAGAFSASGVRSELIRTGNILSISAQVPDFALKELDGNYRKTFPLIRNDFSELLLYKLRTLFFEQEMKKIDAPQLQHSVGYLDVNEALWRRIMACINQYETYKQFTELMKTRNLTYTSVSRSLLHILLDIRKDLMDDFIENDYVGYARMLGFRKEATPLLNEIKKKSRIPLLSKIKDAPPLLDDASRKMLLSDVYAADLYEQVAAQKFSHPFRSEFTQEIVCLE